MVQQIVGGWKCTICSTQFESVADAKECEASHNVIYIMFHKEDLFRLAQFLITKDDTLLNERLVKTIMQYNTGKY